MKILCTGDVHIGRRASRLPADVDPRPHSCADAWARVVDRAIEERVDLVAVSGDLVDRANRFYEAAGPVEAGLRRLAHAGILTVMVAGNHDHDVLPWLVEGLGPDQVRLLGRQGRWERLTVERGGETLHVDGWSFPESHVRTSPLDSYPFAADGAAVLGLLHADLDAPASPYAPVSLAELRRRAPQLWLLGHVHAPALHAAPGGAAVLYPGSPQAMDPGERGAHGVWIVELGAGAPACRFVGLSSVRYEAVDVAVDGVEDLLEVDRRVVDAVRAALAAAAGECGALRVLRCRVRVTGRTALHRRIAERLEQLCGDLALPHGEATASVETVEVRTRAAHDLDAVRGGRDAPALLAGLIHALDTGTLGEADAALLRAAAHRADEIRRARPYAELQPRRGEAPPEPAALLREGALALFDALATQKEEA